MEHRDNEIRLERAIREARAMTLNQGRSQLAKQIILARLRSRKTSLFIPLAWSAGLVAASLAGLFLLMPSHSLAAELKHIAGNGDKGLRHITLCWKKPDGSLDKFVEFYASDDRVKLIDCTSGGVTVAQRTNTKEYPPDGALVIQDYTPSDGESLLGWMGFSSKQLLDQASVQKGAKISVERGVSFADQKVNRYTIDCDFRDAQGQTLHNRSVLISDPISDRPIREESQTSGVFPMVITWDYPSGGPELVEGPPFDAKRVYDLRDEHRQVLRSLKSRGQVVTVKGRRVELCQLWVDEKGSAAAVAKADYAIPVNYSIKINTALVGDSAQSAAQAADSTLALPCNFKGEQVQIFRGERFRRPPVVWPGRVTLEIPVLENRRVIGYAKFRNVPVHRTWRVKEMLIPMNSPFWDPHFKMYDK